MTALWCRSVWVTRVITLQLWWQGRDILLCFSVYICQSAKQSRKSSHKDKVLTLLGTKPSAPFPAVLECGKAHLFTITLGNLDLEANYKSWMSSQKQTGEGRNPTLYHPVLGENLLDRFRLVSSPAMPQSHTLLQECDIPANWQWKE